MYACAYVWLYLRVYVGVRVCMRLCVDVWGVGCVSYREWDIVIDNDGNAHKLEQQLSDLVQLVRMNMQTSLDSTHPFS